MLEVSNLSVGYSGKNIVDRMNLSAKQGEITVIVGPNGCGKSTLLKAIAGIKNPMEGKVYLDQQDILELSKKELAQKISYLPQSRPVPEITVERLVLHGRFPYLSYPRHYKKEDLRIAREALARMQIEDLADCYLSTLSGGQRQKVYIAMALAQDTPVILMDEPTNFLDIFHQIQLVEQARFLAEDGKTVIIVLHDLTMALQMADQIVVMRNGKTVMQDIPEIIFTEGCLDEVFGIKLQRILVKSGWNYYYEIKGGSC